MIKADLHVHSCLSPCADITMVPSVVCSKAKEKRLDIIAVCDHNSCANLESFTKACDVPVLGGIEITSQEEVHVLAYFRSTEVANTFCEVLKRHRLKVEFDPETLGYQLLVNENDEFIAMEEGYLHIAVDMSLEKIVELIFAFDGVPVYAHVDRQFGLLYQLGIFPTNDRVRMAEVRTKEGWQKVLWSGYVPLTNSDAHRPDEIGCRFTRFDLDALSIEEFFDFLKNPDPSKVLTIWD